MVTCFLEQNCVGNAGNSPSKEVLKRLDEFCIYLRGNNEFGIFGHIFSRPPRLQSMRLLPALSY
jgi:hypothetical protein